MLIPFECPVCGDFNEACFCGNFEIKGFKCHGCGSRLDLVAPSINIPIEVQESLEEFEPEEE